MTLVDCNCLCSEVESFLIDKGASIGKGANTTSYVHYYFAVNSAIFFITNVLYMHYFKIIKHC